MRYQDFDLQVFRQAHLQNRPDHKEEGADTVTYNPWPGRRRSDQDFAALRL
jgi:hypothetical protein